MKTVSIIVSTSMLLFLGYSCNAQIKNNKSVQIKNAKTISVKIFGNCGMCETTIEKAGNIKKIVKVDWNKDTKMATLIYDSTKTNQDEILKRIALAGYDSNHFLAPDDVYNNLAGCCQYERENKTAIVTTTTIEDHPMHDIENEVIAMPEVNQLKAVFDNYFAVKDALVKTDGNSSATKAKELLTAINVVKMEKLSDEEHIIWMKVMKDLAFDAKHIADTQDPSLQRDHFINLSKNMYALLKVSKQETPTYYQYCPMANDGKGANWLSKEDAVKNPYYGSQMLNCGKTVETIK